MLGGKSSFKERGGLGSMKRIEEILTSKLKFVTSES